MTYNINRFDWHNLGAVRDIVMIHAIYLAVAVYGILVLRRRLPPRFIAEGGLRGLRGRLEVSPTIAAQLMALIFLALTTLMLFGAAKSGAAVNYFIEWCCVLAIFIGLAIAEASAAASSRSAGAPHRIGSMLVPIAILMQMLFLFGHADQRFAPGISRPSEPAALVELVRAAPRPVIGDDMVAILRGKKPVVWEPAIFAELAALGVWDEGPFIAKIEAREFSFFITQGQPGGWLFNQRYTPEVSRAIVTAYPVERRLAGYVLRFPAGPLPAYAAGLR